MALYLGDIDGGSVQDRDEQAQNDNQIEAFHYS